MTDELKLREGATRREYPEMAKAFGEVRGVMVSALLDSGTGDTDKRERLYRSIRTLDEVKAVMERHLGADTKAIEEYVKSFATTEAE